MFVEFVLIHVLAVAFANGANDNFKATVTLYGSGGLGYGSARRLATVAQVAGSLASVFGAESLLRTFSEKGLIPDRVAFWLAG